jgi:hypothetical protein
MTPPSPKGKKRRRKTKVNVDAPVPPLLVAPVVLLLNDTNIIVME